LGTFFCSNFFFHLEKGKTLKRSLISHDKHTLRPVHDRLDVNELIYAFFGSLLEKEEADITVLRKN